MPAVPDAGAWLWRFGEHAPRPGGHARLICFPHAGGSASSYFALAQALPPGVETYAVQYPGRENRHREPTISDLAEMAERITTVVAALEGPPPVLFGHSMGALLAFEVARGLERTQRIPAVAVVVSARRAPGVRDRQDLPGDVTDEALIGELIRLGATDPERLRHEELRRPFLSSLRSDLKALRSYVGDRHATVGCRVVAFAGESDPTTSVDEVLAWRAHTSASFAFSSFEGGHFYVLRDPAAVGRELVRQCLSRLQPHER